MYENINRREQELMQSISEDVCGQIEDRLSEELHAAQGPEGQGAQRPQQPGPPEDQGRRLPARHPPFLNQIGDAHFAHRDGRGQRRNHDCQEE